MTGRRIAVVGGGAFGLSCAVALARAGAHVELLDPYDRSNASCIAAGMLAPHSERLLDPQSGPPPTLATDAYALWPTFAASLGMAFDEAGAVHRAEPHELAQRLDELRAWNVSARLMTRDEAHAVLPEAAESPALWIAQEARIDAGAALTALRRAFVEAGGRSRGELVACDDDGTLSVAGDPLDADLVVVAAGDGVVDLTACALELAVLRPVKGQLVHLQAPPTAGPTVRTPGAYLVPTAGGVLVGATMVEGACDLAPDRAAVAALRRAAAAVWPHLADAPGSDRVGVRMTSPDGAPMVGPSARPNVLIVAGARRNGWLWAPLVARMVAAYAAGEDPGPHAAALSPARFSGPLHERLLADR